MRNSVRRNLAHELPRQGLSPRVSGVDVVPELDFGLTEAPAQEHRPAVHLARKVHEAEPRIFQLNSQILELPLIAVDLASQGLHRPLQHFGAFARLIATIARRDEVELEDRFTPTAVLLHDVVDNLANEGQRAVCLLDGEQLHEWVSGW